MLETRGLVILLVLLFASETAQAQHGMLTGRRRVAAPAGGFVVGHTREAIDTDTGADAFTITWSDGGSYTPTCYCLDLTRATASATATDHWVYSHGCSDGTNEWVVASSSEHGQTDSDSYHHRRDEAVVAILDPTDGSASALADHSSFAADQVTIDWRVTPGAPPAAYLARVVAFTGADACVAGIIDPADTNGGTVDVTDLGESANFVIVGSADRDAWDETTVNVGVDGIGFYSFDGTTARQGLVWHGSRDARTSSQVAAAWSSASAGVIVQLGGTNEDYWVALSNHASGFTATTTIVGSVRTAARLGYLALGLPSDQDCYVGSVASNTSAPSTQDITEHGFTAQSFFLLSSRLSDASEATDISSESDGFSYGTAVSTTSEFAMSTEEDDGAATTDTQSYTDAAIALVTGDGGTLQHDAEVTALGTTITISHDTTHGTAHNWVWAACEQ